MKRKFKPFFQIITFTIFSIILDYLAETNIYKYIYSNSWLLCLIVAFIFPLLQAWREALYFSLKSVNKSKLDDINEHPYFACERLLVYILMISLIKSPTVIYLMLLFPFLHDGYYFYKRWELDGIYKKTWFAKSTTTTAILDKIFTPAIRTIVFIISLVLYLYTWIV